MGLRCRISCVMRLPYGRSHGSLVAVGYSPCFTMRPRSSTRVLRPLSVSSFAAHPPLMPEPTTIASNEFCSMLLSGTHAPLLTPPKQRRPCTFGKKSAILRRHYGPLARSTGSLQPDLPDARRH